MRRSAGHAARPAARSPEGTAERLSDDRALSSLRDLSFFAGIPWAEAHGQILPSLRDWAPLRLEGSRLRAMLGCVRTYAHPTLDQGGSPAPSARGRVARRTAAGFGDACVAVTAKADAVWVDDCVNDGVNDDGRSTLPRLRGRPFAWWRRTPSRRDGRAPLRRQDSVVPSGLVVLCGHSVG